MRARFVLPQAFFGILLPLFLVGVMGCKSGPEKIEPPKVDVLKAGTGTIAADKSLVYMRYKAMLADGTVFEQNQEGQSPFPFAIGTTQMVAGLHEGLKGVQKGGKYKLTLSPGWAFGAEGRAPMVPPNATVIYEVDILEVMSYQEAQTDLRIKDVVVGTGDPVKPGDTVFIHYVGTYIDGTKFDDSRKRDPNPENFRLMKGDVIPGVDKGITGSPESGFEGMRLGGKRRVRVPPYLGWGRAQRPGVESDQILVFDIELLKIERAKD